MSEHEDLLKSLKRRVVELLQKDGLDVGTCDVSAGYTRYGAACKVTVEVLLPTKTSEPLVDNVVERMKGMSQQAVILFALEEILSSFLPPGSQHARQMAAELRQRREQLPSMRTDEASPCEDNQATLSE